MVKRLTVVLQESPYAQLAEMGCADQLTPTQVLVTIVGEYLKIRQALAEIHHVGIRGHG